MDVFRQGKILMTTSSRTTSSKEAASKSPAGPHGAAPVSPYVIGVLSDTHGRVYPRVAELLRGVNHIVHAGDVGSAEVLAALRSIAPVVAVRGNCDFGTWADDLPARTELRVAGVPILVAHIAGRPESAAPRVGLELGDGGPRVIVSGHSHVASLERRGDVLYLNPGSAGPRRFGRPRTVARIEVVAPRADVVGDVARVTAQILTAEGD